MTKDKLNIENLKIFYKTKFEEKFTSNDDNCDYIVDILLLSILNI